MATVNFIFKQTYGSSAGKESACNAGDLGLGRSLEKSRLPTPVFMDFPGGSDVKESDCNVGDLGLNPGLGRSLGGRHGNPLQHSCLENLHGQRSLAGYSPWGPKESDATERLSPVQHIMVFKTKCFLHTKRKNDIGH